MSVKYNEVYQPESSHSGEKSRHPIYRYTAICKTFENFLSILEKVTVTLVTLCPEAAVFHKSDVKITMCLSPLYLYFL